MGDLRDDLEKFAGGIEYKEVEIDERPRWWRRVTHWLAGVETKTWYSFVAAITALGALIVALLKL